MSSLRFYLFLVFIIWCSAFLHGQNHTNFRHISPILNNNHVSISKTVQDRLGNIWMTSENNILLYDGYNYKLISNETIFPEWSYNDNIKDIIVDNNYDIWIISNFGLLTKYHSKTGVFENFNSLLNNQLINTFYTEDESTWFASKNGIIYRHSDSTTDSITTITHKTLRVKNIKNISFVKPDELYVSTEQGKIFNYSLNSKNITELVGPFTDFPGNIILTSDKNNRLWIGTETYGLFVYDIKQKKFIQDTFFQPKTFNIYKEMFLTLFLDSKGFIWGGTDGGGLYKINSSTGDISLFIKQDSNEFSLSSNTVIHINEDNHKNLWVCTNYGKLNVLPSVNKNIYYHEGSVNNSPQRILSIHKSSKDVIWLGTDGFGLTKVANNVDKNTKETQYFNDINLNKGFYVQSITEDNQSNIWFGTYKNGLWHHNTKTNLFKRINILNSKNQQATDVRTVFNDSKGRIWVGSNISINVYNQNLELITSFVNNTNGLKGSNTESIIEDKAGTIWLGLYGGGLFKLNENHSEFNSSTFTNYSYLDKSNKDGVFSARSMTMASPEKIWLINGVGKLLSFNTTSKIFSDYEHITSIKEHNFLTVISQDSNNVWLSSDNGICHLDLNNNSLKTYHSSDGLQDHMFLSRSVFKDKQGFLYFGGVKGLNYFDPNKMSSKESSARLLINTIEVLNQPIDSLIPLQAKSSDFNIESLKLKYNQSSFTFKFAAIDNILNTKYYYAYRLKGFNNDWIISQTERIAAYTNIPSGNYTFEVKAGTEKDVWNIAPKQIDVTIELPVWRKPIAFLVYFLFIGLIGLVIRRWYLLRKKLFLEKLSHKKEKELHELKMNFFAKMSHEIQTPITLILSPIDNMLSIAEQNGNRLEKQRLNIIANNAERLSNIARELTLVRNKELNTLKLSITRNNLFEHIKNVSLSFKELARKKQIDFAVNCPQNLSKTWYDREKIEHIVYNLLSNAFKFTPKEGNIILNVTPINAKKRIKISISDSGPGIEKEELNHIFELFYQSNVGRKNKGSGIGLAITKELIDLHKGKIEVLSSHSEGTIFTITLPVTESAYSESERIMTSTFETSNDLISTETNSLSKKEKLNSLKKTILIVEDNFDLQAFLKELLINQYNIILADDGEQGYYYAKSNFPDLILSDIMMPKLDGIEMCKKLQKDSLTRHIPIILLTAKNSTNAKLEGLKSGAIEYINKPFNTNELLLKVQNIILSKEHIISKYKKEIISNPEIKLKKSMDEIFLENLMNNINIRLGDPNFKMEDLADSLHMGYSSLYRKCLALTGLNLIDFVRLQRLKKAVILIVKYGYNISEAAFMTGFNDPKYFSKCFKKQFGKTPGLFKKEALKLGIDTYLKNHQLEFITKEEE